MTLTIPGRLPGMNEIIAAAKLRKRNYILGIYHRFMVDRKNPRIEVEIRGVKDSGALEGQELFD